MNDDVLAAVLDVDRREIGIGDEQAAEHAVLSLAPPAISDW